MAFVILSTGSVTGSRLRTLRASTLLLATAVLLLVTLVGGIGLGYGYGQRATDTAAATPAQISSLARNLEAPERRALIDRVGSLSGRLIQLESEAQGLAGRLATIEGTGPRAAPAPAGAVQAGTQAERLPAETTAPSGGPWVPVPETGDVDDEIGLTQLERDLDQVSMRLDDVEAAMAPREQASMAFPNHIPISRRITSGFGIRIDPFTGRRARHTGIDIGAPMRTAIRAAGGGRVTYAGFRPAYGYTVEIDHGNGLSTRYGHASRVLVRRGDVVLPEQIIALVGSTGRSTGPHVHFEVLRNGVPVEPRTFLQHRGA